MQLNGVFLNRCNIGHSVSLYVSCEPRGFSRYHKMGTLSFFGRQRYQEHALAERQLCGHSFPSAQIGDAWPTVTHTGEAARRKEKTAPRTPAQGERCQSAFLCVQRHHPHPRL